MTTAEKKKVKGGAGKVAMQTFTLYLAMDLPKTKKRLTKDEAKKIKGGNAPTENVSLNYTKIKYV